MAEKSIFSYLFGKRVNANKSDSVESEIKEIIKRYKNTHPKFNEYRDLINLKIKENGGFRFKIGFKELDGETRRLILMKFHWNHIES